MSDEKFDAKKSAEKIARFHRATKNAAGQAVLYAIRCGEEINHAKLALPHGDFLPWLEQEARLPQRTAHRYQLLAEQLAPRLAKLATVANLLELPAGALSEAQSTSLDQAVKKTTGGKALTQLYIDFGICKSGSESGPSGGLNEWRAWLRKHHPKLIVEGQAPKQKPGAVGEAVWAEWKKHCEGRGVLTRDEQIEAGREAARLLEAHVLNLGIRNEHLILAPISDLSALHDALTELARLLGAKLKG